MPVNLQPRAFQNTLRQRFNQSKANQSVPKIEIPVEQPSINLAFSRFAEEFKSLDRIFSDLGTHQQESLTKTYLKEWSGSLKTRQILHAANKLQYKAETGVIGNNGEITTASLKESLSSEQLDTMENMFRELEELAVSSEKNETDQGPDVAGHCRTIREKIQLVQQAFIQQNQSTHAHHHDHSDHDHHHSEHNHVHHHHDHSHHHHNHAEGHHGHGCHHNHTQHRGGAVIIDVDEAIHGLYAALGYMVQAVKGESREQIQQHFREETQLMQHDPMGWFESTTMAHGVADLGIGLGIAPVMGLFSYMAIKAGIGEILGARETNHQMNQQMSELEQTAGRLAPLSSGEAVSSPMNMLAHNNGQQMADLKFSKKQNRDGGMVGAFSLSSGTMIAGKVGVETAAKIATFAGATTGPGIGIASTFALGPGAAVSAVGLGGYMVHKSRKKAAAFEAEQSATRAHLSSLQPHIDAGSKLDNYRHFIDKKAEQRKDFFNNYRNNNIGFLAFSSIYSAGTLAKVGVGAATMVAFSDPSGVTPIVLLTLIAAGGAGMGGFSHQFITGHGKHHRYDEYYREDDIEVDRHFLSSVDLLENDQQQNSALNGFALRANCFDFVMSRDDFRQDYLQEVAQDLGKTTFDGKYTWTGDNDTVIEKRGSNPSKREMLKESILRQQNKMQKSELESYLSVSNPELKAQRHAKLRELMQKTITLQIENSDQLLDEKIKVYSQLSDNLNKKLEDAGGEEAEQLQACADNIYHTLLSLDDDLLKSQFRHNQLLEVFSTLKNEQPGDAEWSQTIDRFVKLQLGQAFEPGDKSDDLAASYHTLDKYMFKDAMKRTRDLRGTILEMELQANRQRESVAAATAATTKPSPTEQDQA